MKKPLKKKNGEITESTETTKKARKIIKRNFEKIVLNPNLVIEKFSIEVMDKIFNILFKKGLFNDYENWRDIAYMARHLNNTDECYKLFDKYSRMVIIKDEKTGKITDYSKTPIGHNSKIFYQSNEYNINFDENGVLIKCSKLDYEEYKNTLQYLIKSEYVDEINYFDSKFIYSDDTKIFDDWVANYKALLIKSAYGTGKTYAFKKLIENIPSFKRVLFITYRQSLAHSLADELCSKFGFKSYMDKKVDIENADRAIIQLDSLYRLSSENVFSFLTQRDPIKKYDLIILDETEGLLNHLSYEKIEQHTIHNILERLLIKSNKILCLDGDMSDRTYDFINRLNFDYKIYVNTHKPVKKEFLISSSRTYIENQIEKDLINKKKIVIVCMSATESEKINARYKDTYKICLHNSKERNREMLRNVNVEWAKCDILIYSPSVESGVDFNIEKYFYKCYAFLSTGSTSSRAFSQMLSRVRYFETNEILCHYNPESMKPETDVAIYRYDEMRLSKYNGVEETNLVNILIHNSVEDINSENYFFATLFKLIKDKGHSYTMHEEKTVKDEAGPSYRKTIIKDIAESKIITNDEYEKLLEQKRKNVDITRDEFNSITKLYYKKVFKVDKVEDITFEFLEDHYQMCGVLKNNKLIHLKKDDRKVEKNQILLGLKFKAVDKIDEIIKCLGFDIHNKDIEVNEIDYEKNEIKCLNILNTPEYKTLFNCKKKTFNIDKKNKIYVSYNGILQSYGLKIESIRNRKQENKKKITTYTYKLRNIDIINQYYKREHERQLAHPKIEAVLLDPDNLLANDEEEEKIFN